MVRQLENLISMDLLLNNLPKALELVLTMETELEQIIEMISLHIVLYLK